MRGLVLVGVVFLSLAAAQETRREITNATTPAEDSKPNSDKVPDAYAVTSQCQRVLIFRFKSHAALLAGHRIGIRHFVAVRLGENGQREQDPQRRNPLGRRLGARL